MCAKCRERERWAYFGVSIPERRRLQYDTMMHLLARDGEVRRYMLRRLLERVKATA
jgi:hypothetical protein